MGETSRLSLVSSVASGEVTCAVQVGYSKPAYAKSAYAAPKIVSAFIVCATRPRACRLFAPRKS